MAADTNYDAVLWDFGGVILSSPFDAFNAYEAQANLPRDFIRGLNATNPHDNAWARLERAEIDVAQFGTLFEAEARAAGHELDAAQVLAILSGEIRPAMVTALERVAASFKTACLTNNMPTGQGAGMARDPVKARRVAEILALFDHVVESSKLGLRKPDPRIYAHALALLDVTPDRTVFLDDLGINLKPARAMGIHTIKVVDPDAAIDELSAALGIDLR